MKKNYSVKFEVYYDEKDLEDIMMAHHIKTHGPAPEGMTWEFRKDYSWEIAIKAVDLPKQQE